MNDIKITCLAFVFIFLSVNNAKAQYNEGTPTRDTSERRLFDGDFKSKLCYGVQAGIPIFGIPPIDLSLQVGYRVHEKIEAGVEFNLISTPISNQNKFYGFYGPSVFSRAFLTDMIFVSAEMGVMNMPYVNNINTLTPDVKRVWEMIGLAGIGYKRGIIDDRSYTFAAILYQVFPRGESYSPYVSPLVFKTGIVF